jgi:hypothetical protein
VRRICCCSQLFCSEFFASDYESLLNLGVVCDQSDCDKWCEVFRTVQTHDCDRTEGRCQTVRNAQGNKSCDTVGNRFALSLEQPDGSSRCSRHIATRSICCWSSWALRDEVTMIGTLKKVVCDGFLTIRLLAGNGIITHAQTKFFLAAYRCYQQ